MLQICIRHDITAINTNLRLDQINQKILIYICLSIHLSFTYSFWATIIYCVYLKPSSHIKFHLYLFIHQFIYPYLFYSISCFDVYLEPSIHILFHMAQGLFFDDHRRYLRMKKSHKNIAYHKISSKQFVLILLTVPADIQHEGVISNSLRRNQDIQSSTHFDI